MDRTIHEEMQESLYAELVTCYMLQMKGQGNKAVNVGVRIRG